MVRIRPSCCAICAKPAQFCHFDVPSCLGCRSFFRRSILHQKEYLCEKGRNCLIDKGAKCRACRFDQCVLNGMNVCAIIGNRLNSKKTIERLNRRREQLLKQRKGGGEQKVIGEIKTLQAFQMEFYVLKELHYVEERSVRVRSSVTQCPQFYLNMTLNDLIERQTNILTSAESFSIAKRIPLSKQYFLELIAICGIPNTSEITDQRIITESMNWLFFDCFLCMEMAKTMPTICNIPPKDRVALLLSNIVLIAVFSQFFYSNCANNEMLTFPNGFSPIFFGIFDVPVRVFCDAMKPYKQINLSNEEFVILRCLILLQNASVDLSSTSQQIVQTELENFVNLLMRFEKTKFGDEMGTKRFAELMFFSGLAIKLANEHLNLVITYMTTTAQRQQVRFPSFMESLLLGICAK